MKNLLSTLTFIALIISVISCSNNPAENKKAADDEWQSLFNGKNLTGWTAKFNHHETGDNYLNTFRVADGKIQVNYDDQTEFGDLFGLLFYEKESFSSFHLKFQYKFTEKWLEDAPPVTHLNSGVMFHSQNPKTILKDQNFPVCIEYQILAGEEEEVPRPTGNICCLGTDVYINGKRDSTDCIPSNSKTLNRDEWVTGELIVYKDSLIYHIVNGDTVMKYSKPTVGKGIVNMYDSTIIKDGETLKSGYIALQAEGQGIEFKEIKIMKMNN